jgi:hypothetical protein
MSYNQIFPIFSYECKTRALAILACLAAVAQALQKEFLAAVAKLVFIREPGG